MRTFARIIPVIALLCTCSNAFSDTITLKQALLDKKIKVLISGADQSQNTTSYTPSYTGLCIQMELENLSNKEIKVFLDAGLFLEPEDTSIQRMMVTKDQMIALQGKSKKEIKAYAMCSQMLDKAPGTSTLFAMGNLAKGDLLQLARLISINNFQSNAAQSAIWALTDNEDIYSIYSENKAEMSALRNFVKTAKGITDKEDTNTGTFGLKTEADGTFLNYGKGKLSGSFEFELKKATQITLALYDFNDKLKLTSLSNYTFQDGTNTIKYEFVYKNVPLGNYHLKMTDDKGTLLVDKILTFK